MIGKILIACAVLVAGCGSVEGTYAGSGRESINVPMETAAVGSTYDQVKIARSNDGEMDVTFGKCRLRGHVTSDVVDLGTWSTAPDVCRFEVADGRTFVPAVLTGTAKRTEKGISISLQGSVKNAKDEQQVASYSLQFDGTKK